ncbi:hypothetical protein IFR04_011216 [Cadophora malorum]|uniref:Uncharacterized protein n=1 Tax=Cadophora malorum TaxID=108018 RepID=A0A8H7T9M5_9HELO|nr:hypothetical protein IFR04_011216 [Cadophora malorum]
MKLTPFIAAAILAYTAGAVPCKQSSTDVGNSTAYNQTERTATLSPIPVSVAPDGFMKPDYHFQASDVPSGDAASKQLHSRGAMWKPAEIDSYHEGVKIDIKNSIYELRDKLDYLHKYGHLSVDQANQEIDNLSKVTATRVRINFVTNPPDLDESLSALQKQIVAEIEARRQDPNMDTHVNETQQSEQDAVLANLHAYYILEGLREKIVQLAQTRKLTQRLSQLTIGQARQMVNNTPNMSDKDSEFWELQLKTMEKAINIMTKKKLVEFPASAVAAISNPIKSDFKLPGENNASIDAPTESRSNAGTGEVEQMPNNSDAPTKNWTHSTDNSTTTIIVARRELPMERGDYPVDRQAWLDGRRNLTFRRELEDTEFEQNLGNVYTRELREIREPPIKKRDLYNSSQIEPIEYAVVANHTTNSSLVDEQGEDPFWIDYGAPECMKYILDDDLDLEKLDLFDDCQANAAPEAPDAPDATETPDASDPSDALDTADNADNTEDTEDPEDSEGSLEARDN